MFRNKHRARKKSRKVPKKRRGPRGEGSVFPDRRRGGYRGKVPVGKYPSGKTKYKEVWGATQAECVAAKKAVEPPGPDTLVREWSQRWYDALAIRDSSKADYRATLDRYILPAFGHRRVADITAHDVTAIVPVWSKTLGPNTLLKNLGHLRAMFEAARRARLVAENPVRDAKKPRAKKKRIDPFTPAELVTIIDAASSTELTTIFGLIAGTGVRLGEALALDVTDFDPRAGTVRITKTYDYKHGIRPPKSENSVRTLRVPDDALPCVRRAIGKRTRGPLFRSITGVRRVHGNVEKQFKGFLATLGIRYRSPHQLRHAVASLWASNGVGVADIAAALGDTPATVVSTYIHATSICTTAITERALASARANECASKSAAKRRG